MTIGIVGTGLAGLRVAAELRAAGYDGEILAWDGESRPPYDRPPLTKNLFDSPIRPLAEQGLGDLTELGVVVKPAAERAWHDGGSWMVDGDALTSLVLATGAPPVRTIPGALTVYSADDAETLLRTIDGAPEIAVVGAGWIGTEIASLASGRCTVHLWEATDSILGRSFGDAVTGVWRSWIEDAGIVLRLGETFAGASMPLIQATGARPDLAYLDAAVDTTPRGAVLTTPATQVLRDGAPVDGLYAVGDCADALVEEGDAARVLAGGHWNKALTDGAYTTAAILGTPPPRFRMPAEVFSTQFGREIGFVGEAAGTPSHEETAEGWTMTWTDEAGALRGLLAVDSPRELARARKGLRVRN